MNKEKGHEIPCKHYREGCCYLGEFVTMCHLYEMREIGKKGLESFVANCGRKKKSEE